MISNKNELQRSVLFGYPFNKRAVLRTFWFLYTPKSNNSKVRCTLFTITIGLVIAAEQQAICNYLTKQNLSCRAAYY